jgi:hypothetical protein
MASTPRYGLTDEEVRLIREVEEIKYKIEHTEWTWFNRDEKKAYEERIDLLERILNRINHKRQDGNDQQDPIHHLQIDPLPNANNQSGIHQKDQKPKGVREVGNEEVKRIRKIEELKSQIEKTEWRWDNRDRKTNLEKQIQSLEQTLDQIK